MSLYIDKTVLAALCSKNPTNQRCLQIANSPDHIILLFSPQGQYHSNFDEKQRKWQRFPTSSNDELIICYIFVVKYVLVGRVYTISLFFIGLSRGVLKSLCTNKFFFWFDTILKPSSNSSLFKLIISDQTLIKLKRFLPIYVHFNGQTFSSVFEVFFYFKFFLVKNAKIDFLKEKNGFGE